MPQAKRSAAYSQTVHQALDALRVSDRGLSAQQAAQRLAQYGLNALTATQQPFWKRLIEPFANAFVVVLLVALVLSIVESQLVDAIVIAVIVGVNAIIYYFQQYSVGRVLNTLKSQDVSFVNVLRDDKTVRIRSEELVPGDIVHIEEGMKVPADGRIIECNQIQADESLLTGESLPIHKQVDALKGDLKVYDQRNMLFKGTYVKAGSGLLLVTGTGNNTELGGITSLAASADIGRSPIEHKIDILTKKLIIAIAIVAIIALALAIYRGIVPEEALRYSLVIVVSAVPEGLPVAMTIVLLLSARRMARVKALVKKTTSIETMGAITLIATDKTGTITQNKLSVTDKHTTHQSLNVFNQTILASLNVEAGHAADPLDKILLDSIKDIEIPESWIKVQDFAFNQAQRVSGTLWQHGQDYFLYIKGAPEQVLAFCGTHHSTDNKVRRALQDFTSNGYRTIAFAHKQCAKPVRELTSAVLKDMDFDGFVGMADQLRPEIYDAVADAQKAGIKVVMLTGDHINTAGFIAKKVGIATSDSQVADSAVLASGNPQDIRQALKKVTVFGRVLPEHKYALLKATKSTEITAMTGDGVNDIPALVQADAGITMGSGTDAAKDASDIVLLDNNFKSLVSAIRVGRTALANIRKMVMYLLGTSGGEVLTMVTALVIGIPLPVAAIQILWINLVTDGVSVIPLGLSRPEDRQMLQPPLHPKAPLLNMRQVTRTLVMAVVMCVSVLIVFTANLDKGYEYAQTLAFLSIIVVQWANALNVSFEYKSWIYNFVKPNKLLFGALGVSIMLQLIVFLTPAGGFLYVVPVMFTDALVAIIGPVVASLLAVDLHKLLFHHLTKKQHSGSIKIAGPRRA